MSSINISSNFSLFHSSDIKTTDSSLSGSFNGLSEPVWLYSPLKDLVISTISGQGVSLLDATQIENVIHTWSCGADVKYSLPSELIIDYKNDSQISQEEHIPVEITHDNLFDNETMKILQQGYTIYSVLQSSNDFGSEDHSKIVSIQNHLGEKIVKNFDRKILQLKPIVIDLKAYVLITFEDSTLELYDRDLSNKIDELKFSDSSIFNQIFSSQDSFIQKWESAKNSKLGFFTVLKSSKTSQLNAKIYTLNLDSNSSPKFSESIKSLHLYKVNSETKKFILDISTGNLCVLDQSNSFTFFNLKSNDTFSRYSPSWSSASLIPSAYDSYVYAEYVSSDFLTLITKDLDTKSNEPFLSLRVLDLKYGSIQYSSTLAQSGPNAPSSINSDVESTKSTSINLNNNDILQFTFCSQFIKSSSSLIYQVVQINKRENSPELHRNIQVSCVLISCPQQSTLADLVANAQDETYLVDSVLEEDQLKSQLQNPILPCNKFMSTHYKLLSGWNDLESQLIPKISKESDAMELFGNHISKMSKYLTTTMKQLGQNVPKQSNLLKKSFDDKLQLFTQDRKYPLTQLERVSHKGSKQSAENLVQYSNESLLKLSKNFCAVQTYNQMPQIKWNKVHDMTPFVTSHISSQYIQSWIHRMVQMCEQDTSVPNMAVYDSDLMSYFIRYSMVTSSTFRSSHQGIIPMLLQRQDWANIQNALIYITDLSEYELVQLLMVSYETYIKFKKSDQKAEKWASLDHFNAYMIMTIDYDYDPIYLTDALKALNIEQQESYFAQLVKLLDEHTNLLTHSAKNQFSKINQFLTCFIDAHSLSLITQPNLQSLNKQLLQITSRAQKMLYKYQMFKSEMMGVVNAYKSEMIGSIHGKRNSEWLDDEAYDEKKEDFLQSRYRRKKNYQIETLYL